MENKRIIQYIERFENSSLTSIEIEDGEFKLKMTKESENIATACKTKNENANINKEKNGFADLKMEQRETDIRYTAVKAPIVGIFYSAPLPDAEDYAEVGKKVKAGDVLCLIEAMKMMNELKAPVDGIIREIHSENGQLVEFNQILFEVEPC